MPVPQALREGQARRERERERHNHQTDRILFAYMEMTDIAAAVSRLLRRKWRVVYGCWGRGWQDGQRRGVGMLDDGHTPDTFGASAMLLLICVHLHLGRRERQVSGSSCKVTPPPHHSDTRAQIGAHTQSPSTPRSTLRTLRFMRGTPQLSAVRVFSVSPSGGEPTPAVNQPRHPHTLS